MTRSPSIAIDPRENALHRRRHYRSAGQGVHLAQDGLVEHLGVVARHLRVGVSEHLGDALDRDAVGQRVGGEKVPCAMGRQLLADAADVGQLLQVGVHLLVARHGSSTLCATHSGSVR